MKRPKRIVALFLTLLLICALVSCSGIETERGNEIKLQCEKMMDALIAKDAQAALALCTDAVDEAAFFQAFEELCNYVKGVETYTLKQVGFRTGVDNGKSYYRATFQAETNVGVFYVEATEVDGYNGLYNFRIVSEDEVSPSFTGTLTTLAGSTPLQWGVLAIGVLMLVFNIWMLVDCFKRKINYKFLWILLVALGVFAATITMRETGINTNFSLALFFGTYSCLTIYSTGTVVLRLAFPIGAIIYFFLRKRLTVGRRPQ